MMQKRKVAIWASVAVTIGAIATIVVVKKFTVKHVKVIIGSVLRDDPDPRKQVPIADAEIIALGDISTGPVRSDASGEFRLNLLPGIEQDQTILLELRHPEYERLKIYENASDELYVIRMTPIPRAAPPKLDGPEQPVANVRVRYALTSSTTVSVGSAVKTFEVVNMGNVPCEHNNPCSPDGKWKAAIGGTSLDAGEGNEFEDARLSCIAGPCGFTKIEHDGFSRRARIITASIRNWSDTASFLLEAQVAHTMTGEMIRQSYPVKFGSGMDFTLPPQAQGPSIQAEVNGAEIVYPLGPTLKLTWAACTLKIDVDRTKLYHCDLKPGYRFQQ